MTEVLNDLQGDVVAFHTSPNPENFTEFVAVWTVKCSAPKTRARKHSTPQKNMVLTASGDHATMVMIKE